MKPKHVYFSIAFVFIIVGIVLWQLNDIYRNEKQNQKAKNMDTLVFIAQNITAKQGVITLGVIAGGALILNLLQPKKKDNENPEDKGVI